jgi:hypothetical protein
MTHQLCIQFGRIVPLVLCLALVIAPGCSRPTTVEGEHEHHHEHEARPESYAAAIVEIKEHAAEVATAFSAGKPGDAHDALHELGELLTSLPEVAGDTDLPKPEWQAVKDASQELLDAYGQLDQLMHGAKEKQSAAADTFASVSDKISAALQVLEEKQSATGEQVEAADHSSDSAAGADR